MRRSRITRWSAAFFGLGLFLVLSGCGGDPGQTQTCGNGLLGLDEECDDGNLEDGDGCSSTCENEIF